MVFVIGEGANGTNLGYKTVSLIRSYLRFTDGGEFLKPRRLAFDLNQLISDSRENQSPVSCFFAHYKESTRVLRYFNAGHRSPLLLRPNLVQVIPLTKGGLSLGLEQKTKYTEGLVPLKPGDRIVAFTRGVAKSWATLNDSSAEFSLAQIMRNWKGERASQIAEMLVAHGCRGQFDKVAVVALVSNARPAIHDVSLNRQLSVAAVS
jgi:serine phosphatase RsbU (regulator of sigma subunit)